MDILIVGAGGHGKVVLDILRAAGVHRPVGFLDAEASRRREPTFMGFTPGAGGR